MEKVKALFICENVSELKEKLVQALMFITNKGYSVDVVTNENINIPFVENVHIIDFPEKMTFFSASKKASKLKEIIESKRYDILHTFDNISSYMLKLCLKKSDLYNINLYAENLKKDYIELKKIITRSDNIIVNNEEDYNMLIEKKLGVDVKLIYDLGIDFRKYSSVDFGTLKEETRVKYNLDDEKKYVALLDTFKEDEYILKVMNEISLQNGNIVFLVKDLDEKFKESISKNGENQNIKVIENIKWLELLTACDSAMIANMEPYDSLMFIYSLMLGVPVITKRNALTENYIKEGKNGYLYTKNDVQQIVLAIGRTVNIPKAKLEELPKYNYKLINKFSIEKYAYALNALYSEVVVKPTKDIYIIEDLKKRKDTEKLMNDIKENGAINAQIIVINESVNDEKIKALGAEIISFNISNFTGKYKMKKYISKLINENRYSSINVYGSMSKILTKNKINFISDLLVIEYKKI